MTNDSALIIMQGVVDHYSMDVAQREAWQTLKTAVLAQQTTNSARDEISLCGYGGGCGFKGDTGSCNWRHPFCKYRETSPVASTL